MESGLTDLLLQQQSSVCEAEIILHTKYTMFTIWPLAETLAWDHLQVLIIRCLGLSLSSALIYSTCYLSPSLFCCFLLHWQFFQYMHVLFLTQGYHVAQCLTIQFYCHKWIISCISSVCICLPWSLLCVLKFSNILLITFALLFIRYCAYRKELTTVYFLSPILVFFATALTCFYFFVNSSPKNIFLLFLL